MKIASLSFDKIGVIWPLNCCVCNLKRFKIRSDILPANCSRGHAPFRVGTEIQELSFEPK